MHQNQLAALTTGSDLKTWVLLIAGNVFIIILVIRAITYYAKREWGELIGHFLAAVLIAGFVFAPDLSVTMLKDMWTKVAGA